MQMSNRALNFLCNIHYVCKSCETKWWTSMEDLSFIHSFVLFFCSILSKLAFILLKLWLTLLMLSVQFFYCFCASMAVVVVVVVALATYVPYSTSKTPTHNVNQMLMRWKSIGNFLHMHLNGICVASALISSLHELLEIWLNLTEFGWTIFNSRILSSFFVCIKQFILRIRSDIRQGFPFFNVFYV